MEERSARIYLRQKLSLGNSKTPAYPLFLENILLKLRHSEKATIFLQVLWPSQKTSTLYKKVKKCDTKIIIAWVSDLV